MKELIKKIQQKSISVENLYVLLKEHDIEVIVSDYEEDNSYSTLKEKSLLNINDMFDIFYDELEESSNDRILLKIRKLNNTLCSATVSYFPNNCGMLIISNVNNYYDYRKDYASLLLTIIEKLAIASNYSYLIGTCIYDYTYKFAIKNGYEPIDTFVNKNSYNTIKIIRKILS